MTPRRSIADMRTRVALLAPSETADGFGGVKRSFAMRRMVWAAFEPLRAEERFVAGAPGQSVTHRVTLRYATDINASMRLLRGARLFAIRTVYDPDERWRRLVCLCEEVRA